MKYLTPEGLRYLWGKITSLVGTKQDTLVSGTNIKTVNGNSILGSGNLDLGGSFVVNVVDQNGLAADKTFAEIASAYNSGKSIIVMYQNYIYMPQYMDTSAEMFFYTMESEEFKYLYVDSGDEWWADSSLAQPLLVSGTNIKKINNNGILGSGNLKTTEVVTITRSGNNYSCDKTNAQITTLIDNGATVVLKYSDAIFTYSGKNSYDLIFTCSNAVTGTVDTFTIDQADDIYFDSIDNLSSPNSISSVSATESNVSGGNNVVTITQSNGTSTTFNVKNGQDGATGVNLGDVELVQTTGSNTDKVMSQDAVTEYGRKVTAEDLNGTSDWIKAKLTEEGWEMGKYINSSGTLTNNANTIASPYISVSNIEGHEITITPMLNLGWASCVLYDANKTKLDYINIQSEQYLTSRIKFYSSAIAYIRIGCLIDRIKDLNIIDNDTNEVILDGKSVTLNLCEESNITCDAFQRALLSQELGASDGVTVSQNVVNTVQKNVDAIGRRSYGITSVWNANKNGWRSRSEKKYNVSSLPWVDVVCYNVGAGTQGNGLPFFGFCPVISDTPNTEKDYIGFVGATWDVNFIVRRNGTTLHTTTQAIPSMGYMMQAGFRIDFRRKTILIMYRRRETGVLTSTTIDLSEYDLDLGSCYMYSTMSHCAYVANTYIGWNSSINMVDFSAYFGAISVGSFANIDEHAYPDDDIDGSDCGGISNWMNNWSATQDASGHWVATIDVSSFTNVNSGTPSKVTSKSYLYENWDCIFYVGKIKPTGGSLQIKKSSTAGNIKDVYDITDGAFLTDVSGVYTIENGHTVEVRQQCSGNGKNRPLMFLGTCTVEMWDWVGNVSLNSNLTPMNYDGSKIFGGIPFIHTRPELVRSLGLISSTKHYAQGFMTVTSGKVYISMYDTSSNTYLDKQINNS